MEKLRRKTTRRLKKVRHNISLLCVNRLGHLGKELEISVEVVVHSQHGGDVAAAVAVIGRGPHSDQVAQREMILEPFHHQLVRATDEVDVVVVVELQ